MLDVVFTRSAKTIELKARVTGKPYPRIWWTKDDAELIPSANMDIVQDGQFQILTIKDARRQDSGKYELFAKNPCSKRSYDIDVKVQDRPGAPAGPIKFSSVSGEKMTLWWGLPSDDGGAACEKFLVEKRETSRATWNIVNANVEACNLTVNRLLKNHEYQFRVYGINKFGIGHPLVSEPISAKYQFTVPSAPGSPMGTNGTKDSITIRWERPANDGGNDINGYHIERREKRSVRWVRCTKELVSDLRYKISNLVEGNFYEFRVTAENQAGAGPTSSSSQLIQCREPVSTPGVPGVIRVVDTTRTTVAISWSPPTFDGGANLSGYNVYTRLNPVPIMETEAAEETEFAKMNIDLVKACTWIIPNLTPGADYQIRLCAVNSAGEGNHVQMSGFVTAVDRLEKPDFVIGGEFRSNYIVRAGRSLNINLQYYGRPLPTVTWYKPNCHIEDRAEIQTNDWSTELNINQTNRNDSGKYTITLESGAGQKELNLNVKILDTPGPCADINVTKVTRDSCSMTWSPPSVDGGAFVKSYIVQKREVSRRSWMTVTRNCQRPSYTVTNLEPGSTWCFRIIAENEYGVGEPFELSNSVCMTELPSCPEKAQITNVTATTITVQWTAPLSNGGSRISNYVVQYHQKGVKNIEGRDAWVEAGLVRGSVYTYTVTGLQTKFEYLIRVRAVNESGAGAERDAFPSVVCEDVAISPEGNLSRLYNKTLTVRADQTGLVEIPFIGSPQPKVQFYKGENRERQIFNGEGRYISTTRSSSTSADKIAVLQILSMDKSDSDVYHVEFENCNGLAAYKFYINVLDVPGPVTGPITFTDVSAESVQVNWKMPALDGGAEINGYSVEYREYGRTTWTQITSCTTRTFLKVRKLIRNTEYQFRITAENRFGLGPDLVSDPVRAEYEFVAPHNPSTPEIVQVTKNSAKIEWNQPINDGGKKVLGYWIEKKEINSIVWQKENETSRISSTEGWCHNLIEGLEYQFRVRAENEAGIGRPSEPSKAATIRAEVGAPTELTIADLMSNSVVLTWQPPMNDGGSKISQYVVERRHLPDGRWLRCNYNTINETIYTVTGLTPSDTYEFRVIAKNTMGTIGTPSEPTEPVKCEDKMTVPEIQLDASLLTDCFTLRAGHNLILEAQVEGRPKPKIFWFKNGKEIEAGDRAVISRDLKYSSLGIKDCSKYDSARYEIVARNQCGEVREHINVNVLDRPDKPKGPINISRIMGTKFVLNWNIPELDGGARVTHYIVERRETSRLSWVTVDDSVELTTCTIKKLIKGSEYIARVFAVNEYGISDALESPMVTTKDAFTTPSTPGKPIAITTTKDSVTLQWTRPSEDGGNDIFNYAVERREKGVQKWIRINKRIQVSDLHYRVTGLSKGSCHQFRVAAENNAGIGYYSDESAFINVVDPAFVPAAPSNIRVIDMTKTSLTAKWSTPLYDGDSPIQGYVIEYAEVPEKVTAIDNDENEVETIQEDLEWERSHASRFISSSTYNVTGLKAGCQYKVRVYAVNDVGCSEQAAELAKGVITRDIVEAPEFNLEQEKNVVIRAGAPLVLKVNAKGRPAPSMTWRKEPNGEELLTRAYTECSDGKAYLEIERTDRYDFGRYTVIAENSAATREYQINVKVTDSPGPVGQIIIKEVNRSSAMISWEPPIVDGFAKIKYYIVEKREAGRRSWQSAATKCERLFCKVNNLEEGALYQFRVLAVNENGIGEPRECDEPVLAAEVPSSPCNIQITQVTDTTVSFKWDAPEQSGGSRVKGYVIEAQQKGTDKREYTTVSKTKFAKATAVGLQTGTDYYFRVKAFNDCGMSDPRDLVSSVKIQEPKESPSVDISEFPQKIFHVLQGRPTEIKIPIFGKPSPKIEWTNENNEKLIEIAEKRLIKNTKTEAILEIRDSNYSDVGTYKLNLKNDSGEFSLKLNLIVLAPPTEPVGEIEVTDVDATQCVLSWNPPTYDGGAMLSNYVVEKREVHRPIWQPVSATQTRNTIKVTHLSENTEYVFRVSCQNRFGIGRGLMTSEVLIKSRFQLPGPPSTPEVININKDSITLTWNMPVNDGGTEILGYIVERKQPQGSKWIRATPQMITTTKFVSMNLIEGMEYLHRIRSVNSKGESKPGFQSEPVKCMDPVVPPGPCEDFRVTDMTSTSCSFSWVEPSFIGGAKITGYFIEFKTENDFWRKVNNKPIRICEYVTMNLPEGNEFRARVLAVNAGGEGEPLEIETTIKAMNLTGPPLILNHDHFQEPLMVKQGQMISLVVWFKSKPQSEIKWTKEGSTQPLEKWTMIAYHDDHTELMIRECDRYSDAGIYKCTLTNSYGTDDVIIKVDVIGRPDAPEGPIQFSDKDEKSVRLTWKPVVNDGGAEIQKYLIEYRCIGRKRTITAELKNRSTSHLITGLTQGVEYFFKVFAENYFGLSAPLEAEESVIPKSPKFVPTEPHHVEINEITKHTIGLSWAKPIEDGGSRVTGYHVERMEANSEHWFRCNKVATNNMSFIASGLVENGVYKFRVVAVNEIGESEPSEITDEVECKLSHGVPSAPEEIEVQHKTKDSITIAWSKPESDGGKPIIGYLVEYRINGFHTWKIANEETTMDKVMEVGGLDEGTDYEIRVYAVNQAGKSRPKLHDGIISTKRAVGDRPEILEELLDVHALATKEAKFECKVNAKPAADIEWFKFNQRLAPSKKYKFGTDGVTQTLTITNVTYQDEGSYYCFAKNQFGREETQAKLTVESEPRFDQTYKFKENFEFRQGSSINISIPYVGKPEPSVLWMLNGQRFNFKNMSLETTDKYTYLMIPDADREIHCGKYTAKLNNAHGQNTYAFNIDIHKAPEAPLNLRLVSTNYTSINLAWDAPIENGGSAITNYILEKKDISQSETDLAKWTLVTSSTLNTEFTATGLTESHAYRFRVSARNLIGCSESVEVEEPILASPPFKVPDQPTNVVVTNAIGSSAMVSWKAPSSDNGSKVKYYHIEKRERRRNSWTRAHLETDFIKHTTHSVSNLVEGLFYEFRVFAENEAGLSPSSPVSKQVKVAPKERSMAPTIVEPLRDSVAKPGQNLVMQCKVSGSPKPLIKWYRAGSEITAGSKYDIREGRGNYFSLTIMNCCADDETEYSVRACNSSGAVNMSAKVTVQIPAKIKLPRHMMYEATKARKHEVVSIKVPIEGYPQADITWSLQGQQIFNDLRHTIYTTPSFTTMTINDADRKDSGFYVVQAKNRFACDAATVELLIVDVPQEPENLKVSEVTRDSCELSWVAPKDLGGVMLQKYSIEMCPASSNKWTQVSSTRSTHYTVINLSGRTRYQFRVVAINDIGASKPSSPSETITTKEDRIIASNYDDWVESLDRFQPYVATISDDVDLTTKYHICEELGSGQFGVCHRVQEIATERAYVAKFMKVDGADRVHVRREIDLMRKLQHPKILQLHEVFDHRNEIIMLTEFISGSNLLEKLANAKFELTEQKCIGIVKQVAEALAFIHTMKIGYFDLKPTNVIFVSKRMNQIKLMDFGQSRLLTPGETIRLAYKTPDFVAPEVVTNDNVSLQTDIWSLGVLVYFMVTGKLPFHGNNAEETRNNVISSEYDFNIPEMKNVSTECLDFIERCLQREMKPRMNSIDAIQHPWLQPIHKELNHELILQRQNKINTKPHRELYKKTKASDTSDSLIGVAKWSSGGALKSNKGHLVSKVRTAPWDLTPKLRQIMPLMVKEGQTPKLLCRIENSTGNEKITWYHNNLQLDTGFTLDSEGNEIKNNDKYEAEFSAQKGASLYIVSIKPEDEGNYRVRVENSFGYSTVSCEVCVERRSDRTWTRTKRSLYMNHKVRKGARGREVEALRRAPEFTLPLYNKKIVIGDTVEFAVTVTVHPDPTVTWFKDGQRIIPDTEDLRYSFSSDKGLFKLTVRNCSEDMSGEYSVHAKNPYGEDTSKAILIVSKPINKTQPSIRPLFRRLLSNLEVEEGSSARFNIRVTGQPKPELKWEKDGVEISQNEHHQIVWESANDCYLICYNTFQMDSGLYKVTATNSAGVASCQAVLTVKPIQYQRKTFLNPNADLEAQSKRFKLAQLIAGNGTTPVAMNECAKLALAEAQQKAVIAQTEGVASDEDPLEELALTPVESKFKMPYSIPEPREIPNAQINNSISKYQPISEMKWYRSSKKAAEKIDPMHEAKRPEVKLPKHIKQLLLPDTASLIPQKRVKSDLNLRSDKYRTVKSILCDEDRRQEIEDIKADPSQTWVKYYRPEADDELVLKPREEYINEIRARDILREEEIEREALRVKKFKTGKELRKELFGDEEEFNLEEVEIPKKKLDMGTPSAQLERRHKKLIPDLDDMSRRRRRNLQDDEDEIECMRNIKSGSFKYEGVLEKTILESKSDRRQKPEAQKKARYVPQADEDEAYLKSIKPKKSSISMNNNNNIPRRRLTEEDFETMELLRPIERRQPKTFSTSSQDSFKYGLFEEEIGDETIEFTSSNYSKPRKARRRSNEEVSQTGKLIAKVTHEGLQLSYEDNAKLGIKNVIWFRDEERIGQDSRRSLQSSFKSCSLTFNTLRSSDAGFYVAHMTLHNSTKALSANIFISENDIEDFSREMKTLQ